MDVFFSLVMGVAMKGCFLGVERFNSWNKEHCKEWRRLDN